MISNAIKFIFAVLVLGLLGFIAFTMYMNQYTKERPMEVVEKKVNEKPILEQIESIGKIELVKYQLKDAYEYTKKYEDLLPDAKILIVISGEAVGCIDFRKIQKSDILTVGDSMVITMPEPELCYYKIDHQNTKIYDLTKGIGGFMDRDKTEMTSAALKKAEKAIERAALESDILQKTKESAETVLKPLLVNLTEKQIIFHYLEVEGEIKIVD